MLTINVQGMEFYDENEGVFKTVKNSKLQLEHSLVSVSRWESKWHIPFLSETEPKTPEMWMDYVRCMTVNQGVDPSVYDMLTADQFQEIRNYIDNPMTATTVKDKRRGGRAIITNERIYCWMTQLGIPFECEKWHLNRLLMLIRVCNAAQTPPKKMGKKESMNQHRSLNAARRARAGANG